MVKKFEAFKASDIKTKGVYLKNYLDGDKPNIINHENSTISDKLEEMRNEIRNMSWKKLEFKKDGGDFSGYTVYFNLPKNIINKIKELDILPYNNLKMNIEPSNFNRTHIDAIPLFMRGLGLGIKMYKTLIANIGYATTFGDASPSAKKMWSYLIQDPAYYVLIVDNGVLLIDKNYDKLEEVVINYLKSYYGINIPNKIDSKTRDSFYKNNIPIKVDPELAKKLKHMNLSSLDIDIFRRYDRMKDKIDYDSYES